MLEVGAFAILTGVDLVAVGDADGGASDRAAGAVSSRSCRRSPSPRRRRCLPGRRSARGARRWCFRVAWLGFAHRGRLHRCSARWSSRSAAPLIVAGFTSIAALAAVTVRLLRVAALFQVSDGANIVARAVLRGVGDVRFAAVVGVVTAWLMTPPLTWLLGWHAGLGASGGWLGLCGESVIGARALVAPAALGRVAARARLSRRRRRRVAGAGRVRRPARSTSSNSPCTASASSAAGIAPSRMSARVVEADAGQDRLAVAAGADERAERGRADVDDGGGLDAGEDRRAWPAAAR